MRVMKLGLLSETVLWNGGTPLPERPLSDPGSIYAGFHPGGTLHMKGVGMLVGNFELNP